MTDLRRWASVDAGRFEFGEGRSEEWSGRLSELSNADLLGLMRRRLLDRLPDWRAGCLRGDRLDWFERSVVGFPEVVEKLTPEELDRLGGARRPVVVSFCKPWAPDDLTPALVDSWRASGGRLEGARTSGLLQVVRTHPGHARALLTDQESHELGVGV